MLMDDISQKNKINEKIQINQRTTSHTFSTAASNDSSTKAAETTIPTIPNPTTKSPKTTEKNVTSKEDANSTFPNPVSPNKPRATQTLMEAFVSVNLKGKSNKNEQKPKVNCGYCNRLMGQTQIELKLLARCILCQETKSIRQQCANKMYFDAHNFPSESRLGAANVTVSEFNETMVNLHCQSCKDLCF